jgi:uncharacterized protein YndB with AHSA1/START domain
MDNLTINISKEYKCDAKKLFTAISEGILFKYTGALMDKLKMDFREGGTLFIDWGDSSMKGEFKTIRPYEKVSFTWNNYSKELNKEMNTLVTITIKESDGKSRLTLVHEGIGSEKDKADMTWGWNDGLDDMYKTHFKFN